MAELPDISGRPDIERHVSPDGRIVIDLLIEEDEEDVRFRGGPFRRPRVFAAADGRSVIDLFGVPVLAGFEWPADGGLELRIAREGVAIRIAPDGLGWSGDFDGWQAHAAGADGDRLRRAIELRRSQALARAPEPGALKHDRQQSWIAGLAAAGVIGLFAFAVWDEGWSWPKRFTLDKDEQVNAWLPRCPEPIGNLMMKLGSGGDTLEVRRFGGEAWPVLARLPGDAARFGDGLRVVEPKDDGGATVWPDGLEGAAVECVSQRAAAGN